MLIPGPTPCYRMPADHASACVACPLATHCRPGHLAPHRLRAGRLSATRLDVPRGATLHRHGQPFRNVYRIHAGSFKACLHAGDGREHIAGFRMPGELIGLDGLDSATHTCDAVALEASQVCAIPFARLREAAQLHPGLQRLLHQALGGEIAFDHRTMLMLAHPRAEARLAAFLLDLSRRQRVRGLCPTSLVLRMTRAEIGIYLGLKLETVSRCLHRLCRRGMLGVRLREVQILDLAALEGLACA